MRLPGTSARGEAAGVVVAADPGLEPRRAQPASIRAVIPGHVFEFRPGWFSQRGAIVRCKGRILLFVHDAWI